MLNVQSITPEMSEMLNSYSRTTDTSK